MTDKTQIDDIEKDNESGFTLVEVMAVMAIIAIGVTIVVVNVLPNIGTAKAQKAAVDISVLSGALEQYHLDLGSYPDERDGLQALRTAPSGLRNGELYRTGGYIKKLPTDPWGYEYYYRFPGEYGAFDLYSYGADGEEGGEGLDADVTSWSE